jgi:hypothetical protein
MTSIASIRNAGFTAIVAMLVGTSLGACSGRSVEPETQSDAFARPVEEAPLIEEAPLSLRLYSGGGNCARNCWWVAELSAAGDLLLEDEQGAEHFELEPGELDEVWLILDRPDMTEALQDPEDCHTVSSYVRSVTLTWPNGMAMVDETAASCFLGGSNHPYRLVYNHLLRLVEDSSVCASNATDNEELRGFCLPLQ